MSELIFNQFQEDERVKKAKQILANMALEDLLGKDYMDLSDYYVGGKNDENDSDVDDDDFDWVDPVSDGSCSWEVRAISLVQPWLALCQFVFVLCMDCLDMYL